VILADLKPPNIERSSPHSECMDGTRKSIFDTVDAWTKDLDAPNILWIKGYPGVGKSAIASSLVERFIASKRLGSSFFFQRDRAKMTDPYALWRVVAFDLGRQYPTVRKHLVAKLREDEVRPTTSNLDTLFHIYIQEPLQASEDIPIGRLPIVVVDALDECGGLDGHISMHRKNLLRTIKMWSDIPAKFKLIVTSRSEADIEQAFRTFHHHLLEIKAGLAADIQSLNDTRAFFEQEFQDIRNLYPISLSLDWPGTQVLTELTNKAAGLFIWAKTVTRFINSGEPQEQLVQVLHSSGTGDMGDLYCRILSISFPKPSLRIKSAFHSIFGALIFLKTPLSASAIAKLREIEDGAMEDVCNRMRSVLDIKEALRISHQSFSDFLLDRNSCPKVFLIDKEEECSEMAFGCLRTMKGQLKFNICGFESSYMRNDDLNDLHFRIKAHISRELSYSCLSWADHLTETKHEDRILTMLHHFMYDGFLFWLEVMSVYQRIGSAPKMLQILVDWIGVRSVHILEPKNVSDRD
jgi:hypothetical protein